MWVFFSRRLRMWAILAIGAPILAFLLGKVGDLIESRSGPTTISKALHSGRRFLDKRTTGPLARRKVEAQSPAR